MEKNLYWKICANEASKIVVYNLALAQYYALFDSINSIFKIHLEAYIKLVGIVIILVNLAL